MGAMIIAAALFASGACAGSFFYTLALRITDGTFAKGLREGFLTRSACGSCSVTLSPLQLVPVLGYLILRGRCARCGARISPLYPLSEILFGALALGTGASYGASIRALTLFLVMAAGITIAIVDIHTMKVPIPLAAAITLLAVDTAVPSQGAGDAAWGFLLMFLFFGIILLLFPGAFGGGDLWYASALGTVFGLELSVVLLELSLISGAIFGIVYAVGTGKGLRTRIPFAPFLTLGTILTVFLGRKLLLVYYGIIL
ncbi:MAG: prepilin peptidase [Spirochaetes bacterium]|nr:prepilin peptidase [Spirochaetota bacterium]